MTSFILIFSAFITSVISAVFGMAGGIILMAILTALTSVAGAMIVHGIIQGTANFSRAVMLGRYIQWRALRYYLLGLCLGICVATLVSFVPPKWLVLSALGVVAFLPRILSKVRIGLDIRQTSQAILCGGLVMAVQIVAGAAGPVLDVFFAQTKMSKHEIVATKAATQVASHIAKIAYFLATIVLPMRAAHTASDSSLLSSLAALPLLAVGVACVATVGGTWVGRNLMERFTEDQFRKWYRCMLEGIGCVFILSGQVVYWQIVWPW